MVMRLVERGRYHLSILLVRMLCFYLFIYFSVGKGKEGTPRRAGVGWLKKGGEGEKGGNYSVYRRAFGNLAPGLSC